MQQAQQGVAKKREELERLNQAEGDNSAAISKCEKQLERYQQQVLNAGRNINLTEAELRNLENTLQETNNKLNSQALENYKQKMSDLGDKVKSTGDKIKSFGEGMDKAGTTLMKLSSPIVGLSVAATKAAIDFESAFTGVIKTVDGTDAELEKLKNGILEMSKTMPESASDIAKVAESAGQLGIKTKNIEDFTKVMVMLGDSTNLSSEEAATSLARLANITGMSQDKFSNLGSSIVACGNNFATTESEITNMAMRLAGAGSQIGLTEADIIGLSTALSSVGIEAEVGGSAFSKVMVDMQLAVESGGESLEQFASVAGMSVDEFSSKFKEDASGAIVAFIQGLGRTEESGQSAIAVLDAMGITETRLRDALLRASGASDTFTNAINISNQAFNENTALSKEAETRYKTMQSQIEMLKNRFKALGIEIGEQLMPYVSQLMDKLEGLVKWFSGLDDSTKKSIINFGLYTFGVGTALKVTGKFASGIGSLVSAGGSLIKFLGTNTSLLGSLGTKLTATTTATGALKLGVGALSKAYLPLAVATTAAGAAIYAVKEHSKAMNDTILKSSEEMGFLEEAFVKLSGGTVKTRKELEEMGLVQEELSDGLTKEFKSAINSATSDIQNFNFQLSQVKIDGVITSEECDSLQSRVNDLCNSAIETINSKTQEMQSSLGKAFEVDGILDNDEQKIIEYYTNAGEKNKAEVQRMQSEINELLRKVREEGYELTGEDEAKIKNYYAEIKRIELEFQASNNEEILFEKNKFLNRANNLDLESAQKLLSERRKYYEEERAEKLAQYDTLIADLQKNLENMDTETRASAERKIESLQAEKEQQSELMQQYYNEEYNALVEQNSNLAGELDKYNASILTSKDKACQEEFETLKSHYENINQVTESGLTTLYNKTTEAYENVYVEVDKVTGEVVGLTRFYSNEAQITAGKVTGANSTISNSMNGLSQAAQNSYNNIIRAVTDSKNTHVNSANQIVNADGRIVGSLNEVKTTFGGVKSGILDINGTPVTVHVNKEGAITNANQIKSALDEAAKDRTANIRIHYYSDGRGNVTINDKVVSGGYATGTTNATRGFHLVGEQGPELVYFSGGETVLNALKTRNILTSGGYFDKGSYESKQLINNYNNSRKSTVINNYSNELDLNKLANAISAAVSAAVGGLSIKMNTKEVAKMIDKENGVTNAKNRRLRGC